MKPMLASCVRHVDRLITDDMFVCEPKLDGVRMMISGDGERVCGWGRDGQRVQLPSGVARDLSLFHTETVLDGEKVGERVIVFDVVRLGGRVLDDVKQCDRRILLERLMQSWDCEHVVLMPQFCGTKNKRRLSRIASKAHGEGLVYKHVDGFYVEGERSDDWIKHKFVKDVDVVIIGVGVDKQNLSFGFWDGSGYVDGGTVSALTGDGPRLRVGDVATVQCLYVTKNRRLVQVVKPVLRLDKLPVECTLDQLDDLVTDKEWILKYV